jgi:uncharacterized protein YhfF
MNREAPSDWRSLPQFAFGDGPALADELLALVLAGAKTATCWDAREGDKGVVPGGYWVVRDGAGVPRVVTQTTSIAQCRFNAVDAEFAWCEGEDDRTLASWRREHAGYFQRAGHFAPDMLLWCEQFRLAGVITPEGIWQRC